MLGDENEENAWTIQRLLRNMEILSGLKVKFEKCSLSGVNVEVDRLCSLAEIQGCRVGSIPFSYLGITVGDSHRKTSFWSGIIQKIRNRLRNGKIGIF